MRQSFKYRLYPNRQQPRIIDDILGHCRLLYHRLLAEHKDAYKKSGTTLSYMAQANSFPARKQAIPRAFASAARCRQAARQILSRVLSPCEKRGETRLSPF